MTADPAFTWPQELDALRAAPEHHTLLFENDLVRVLDIRVPPGHTVPLHTHCWPGTLRLLQWSHFLRRDAAGTLIHDSRTAPIPAEHTTTECPTLPPHTLENIGATTLHLIGVEFKTAPPVLP